LGGEEEFDELYLTSRDRLVVQITAICGDATESRDFVQEAFARAWTMWGRIATYEDPEGWIRRVAYRLAVGRWRRSRKLMLRADVHQEVMGLPGEQIGVIDALQRIPVSERRAIVLHHVCGLSVGGDGQRALGTDRNRQVVAVPGSGAPCLGTRRQRGAGPVEINDLVDRRLTELTTATTSTGSWLEPSEIRHQGRKRQIRRRGTGIGSALVVVVLLATLVPIGLGSKAQPHASLHVSARLGPALQLVSTARRGRPIPTDSNPAAVAQTEQQFSLSLLKQLSASGTSSSNVLVSPSSLSTALSMLELGARGATETQIAAVLDSGNLTAQQQAAGWSALSAELALAGASGGISLQSANSLWLQQGLAMDPTFMSALSRYFASGIWQVDFASNPTGAIDALNRWVTLKTRGHITTLFAPGAITDQTALILANAVYFKAAWQEPFTGATSNGSFHLADGTTTSVPYLHTPVNGPLDGSVSVGSGIDAVQLPYKGGRLAALIIMPTSQSIAQFSASLSQAVLAHVVSGLAPSWPCRPSR
jgi:Serpin (serine protease inhibitor)/Sigma-70 region 2